MAASQTGENKISPEMIQLGDSGGGSGILTVAQCRSMSPADMSRLFFHSVREGNADQVTQLLKVNSSLVSELDDQLYSALHYAVKCSRVDMISLLIRSGANVNIKGKEGSRPLHLAASLNQLEVMQELLGNRKVRVDALDDRGQTPLHVACRRNHEEAVKILLSSKASLELKELDGTSVLHAPSRRNNLQLCQILASETILVAGKDKHGVTPLMVAATESGEDVLNHFISVCKLSSTDVAQMMNRQDVEGNSAVHYAARNNKASVLLILHSCGADINMQNLEKSTPLHLAATLGHNECVSALLKLGALPNLSDKLGRTPLHCCVISKQSEICGLLLAAGCHTRSADTEFMTPFHWACRRGQLEDARKLLDADPGSLTLVDIFMRTGLHWAVLASSPELAHLLMSRAEANPGTSEVVINASDVHDKFPVHYAVELNNFQLVKTLLALGADFHAVDRDGRTATQLAVKLGHDSLVQDICGHSETLKRQALRHRDAKGLTSLLIAAEQGHETVFKYLLSLGADFTVKDELGRTALMLSVGNGHIGIASLMIDKGVDVNASDSNRNTALHNACKFAGATVTDCIELLLANGAQLQQNYNGETPVDVAVLNSNAPAISLLFSDDYRNWVMGYRKDNGMTHMDILIQHSPQTAMMVLNSSMAESTTDRLDKNYMVAYNFLQLDPGPDDPSSAKKRYLALRTMVKKKRMELLQHPVCQALLDCKWSV